MDMRPHASTRQASRGHVHAPEARPTDLSSCSGRQREKAGDGGGAMSQRGMRRLEEELKKVGGQRENDVIEGLVAKLKAAAAGKKDKDVGASLCGAEVVGGEAVGGEVLRAGRLGRGVAGGGGRHKENGIESRERELIYMRSDAEAGARHGRRPHLAASVAFLPSARVTLISEAFVSSAHSEGKVSCHDAARSELAVWHRFAVWLLSNTASALDGV